MITAHTSRRPSLLLTPEDLTKPPLELEVFGKYDWHNQTRTKTNTLFPVATATTNFSTSTGNGWDNQNDLDTNQ